MLVDRFFAAAERLLAPTLQTGQSLLEVGCGPGYSTQRIARWKENIELVGGDLSPSLLEHAKKLNPAIPFVHASVYSLPHADKSFDAVLLMEVLEHLEHPQAALSELHRVARNHVLLSTPREPLWRFLNFSRGKYISDFGNTPGHIQHWSTRGLKKEVSTFFNVLDVATPVPWTILLLSPK